MPDCSRYSAASHVGRDHAFLDQLVRVVALEHAGLGDRALRVQHEAHFAALELDRAALLRAPCPAPCRAGAGADLRQQPPIFASAAAWSSSGMPSPTAFHTSV
jgi:hypothetical protein